MTDEYQVWFCIQDHACLGVLGNLRVAVSILI